MNEVVLDRGLVNRLGAASSCPQRVSAERAQRNRQETAGGGNTQEQRERMIEPSANYREPWGSWIDAALVLNAGRREESGDD